MRALDDAFLQDLKGGMLRSLTEMVQSDTSLCLELRGGSINIYYRGGSLLRIEKSGDGYSAFFDMKYFRNKNAIPGIGRRISTEAETRVWTDVSPVLKQAMDRYFSRHRTDEREFQQLLVRENNFGRVARSTDYYICDIEYQQGLSRFDAVAVHWPSMSAARKGTYNRRLVFVEMKYGDQALDGEAGLHKHIEDVNEYLGQPGHHVSKLKEDMVNVFKQKRYLGLVDCGRDLGGFSDKERPLLLLVLANHDPDKRKLRQLLEGVPESPRAELRIATATFLGYGLYDQGIHTIEETFERFGDYVHKGLARNARSRRQTATHG